MERERESERERQRETDRQIRETDNFVVVVACGVFDIFCLGFVLFMLPLIQTSTHKMAAPKVVFSQLSNIDF